MKRKLALFSGMLALAGTGAARAQDECERRVNDELGRLGFPSSTFSQPGTLSKRLHEAAPIRSEKRSVDSRRHELETEARERAARELERREPARDGAAASPEELRRALAQIEANPLGRKLLAEYRAVRQSPQTEDSARRRQELEADLRSLVSLVSPELPRGERRSPREERKRILERADKILAGDPEYARLTARSRELSQLLVRSQQNNDSGYLLEERFMGPFDQIAAFNDSTGTRLQVYLHRGKIKGFSAAEPGAEGLQTRQLKLEGPTCEAVHLLVTNSHSSGTGHYFGTGYEYYSPAICLGLDKLRSIVSDLPPRSVRHDYTPAQLAAKEKLESFLDSVKVKGDWVSDRETFEKSLTYCARYEMAAFRGQTNSTVKEIGEADGLPPGL
jgi:hypothetical protein